eukprot:5292958-Pyramimonas_sp.AAC.1
MAGLSLPHYEPSPEACMRSIPVKSTPCRRPGASAWAKLGDAPGPSSHIGANCRRSWLTDQR